VQRTVEGPSVLDPARRSSHPGATATSTGAGASGGFCCGSGLSCNPAAEVKRCPEHPTVPLQCPACNGRRGRGIQLAGRKRAAARNARVATAARFATTDEFLVAMGPRWLSETDTVLSEARAAGEVRVAAHLQLARAKLLEMGLTSKSRRLSSLGKRPTIIAAGPDRRRDDSV
jgi:hypothetical protein